MHTQYRGYALVILGIILATTWNYMTLTGDILMTLLAISAVIVTSMEWIYGDIEE